ncbi:hypothetical protein [Aeromonas enteropelogenes]|uniref:Uncharacterized protein n=2 Tax=Aeromonas enteropelogenes TaxID=29489 RepID=A0A175VDL6_AEREN|nr:hypothetical protein [Aeromonas enteropelogenes]KXU78577.1 hypothetical protein LCR_04885 [Aeromonas enteropelogenes]
MDYTLISGIVGGLGIGTLLNSIISNVIARSAKRTDRLYEEKRNAYLGLLDALHKAAVHPSDAASKEFALWQTRCNLFGSEEVSRYTQRIIDTNDGPRSERNDAFDGLLKAMKTDLAK